jgi:hypothetical protein
MSEAEAIIEVFAPIGIPPEVRQALAAAPDPQLRLKVLLGLRRELLLSERTGFSIQPVTATSIEQFEAIHLTQQICVAGGGGSEVSRLLDSVIEIATTALRAMSIFAPVVTGGPSSATTSSATAPDAERGPGRMYQ